MASNVVLRKRHSFLKILLLVKHTRGFLTNLLLGRKYFLCSNYMGGANNKINIRQFCEKKVRQRYLHHPRVTVKAQRQVQVSWQKIKRKPLFSVLGPWVTCTSREHHKPNMQGTRRNSLKTGRNMVVIVANAIRNRCQTDMIFVKNFTQPDFQAKRFTPQKCVICYSFFFSQINSVNASNINSFRIFYYK